MLEFNWCNGKELVHAAVINTARLAQTNEGEQLRQLLDSKVTFKYDDHHDEVSHVSNTLI